MLSTLAHYPEEELRVAVVVVSFAQRKRRKGAGVVKACPLLISCVHCSAMATPRAETYGVHVGSRWQEAGAGRAYVVMGAMRHDHVRDPNARRGFFFIKHTIAGSATSSQRKAGSTNRAMHAQMRILATEDCAEQERKVASHG